MTLAATIKAKLGTLTAEAESLLTAAEPEFDSLALIAAGKLLTKVAAELPTLETQLIPVLSKAFPVGQATAIAAAITAVAGPWLTTTLAKVAPAIATVTTPPPANSVSGVTATTKP